ncbi:MAG: efflux RND transporter periplasmic adaptor subunit [Gammaproteobacteria bacterium]|nr:efflux RND transporter periplasmic adaptor subunit [Gammaproteobacteria bacterium]
MAEQSIDRPKPRLWLRLLVVVLLVAALTAALAYQKTVEIQAQIAQGSQLPPPISVTVAEARPGEWNRRIKAIGTLVAFQGVDITSEVSGVIKSINFDSGDEVEAGWLLVEFDNRTEMANLEAARAQYDADNRQYQRLLKLKDQSFVTNNDIDTQAALVDVAGAQVNVAKTALSKKRIFAPFSGKLGIRRVDIGEYIAPGSTIVTLLDLNELYLDFTLPEENFNDLVEEQLIEFRVRSYPDQTFTARVETWNPELDADTRNISIRAIVDNRKRRLAPGMFADMQVRSRRKVSVLTVPETSIFYNIYGQAVYVLEKPEASATDPDPDSRLAARQVDVAYRANGVAGITSGVKDGDLVVTAGQLKLYPNLRVAIVDDVPEYQSKAQ